MKTVFASSMEARLSQLIARPPGAVQARLQARVQASARQHQDYLTLRHERYRWQPVAPGVREHLLREDAALRVSLQQLDPGTMPRLPRGALAAEVLVVDGQLLGQDTHAGTVLRPQGYLTLGAACEPLRWQACAPTLVYLRSLQAVAPLPALEAHWWQLAARQADQPRQRRWWPSRPGVDVMPLCGDSDVVSMLVRFGPGGAVPDHHHALDEDCLVLDGDMFLGDILLRPLDYQLAPAGGGHFGEMSDGGVTFFFHGAMDPVLRA